MLEFDSVKLRENLTFCEAGRATVNPRSTFEKFEEAEHLVKELWPNYPGPLKMEMPLKP